MCHTEETDEGGRLEVGPLVDGFLIAVVEPAETTMRSVSGHFDRLNDLQKLNLLYSRS